MKPTPSLLALALALSVASQAGAAIRDTAVVRSPDALTLTWASPDPVDVYLAERPDAPLASDSVLARGATGGGYVLDHPDRARRYFVLVDAKDRQSVTVAERALPLEGGSNFRDVGGYVGAGGRHVRWGLIYRSGGQALLTPEDVAQVKAMGVAQLVDLRSSEERVLAPTRIEGVPYAAVGYSMMSLLAGSTGGEMRNGVEVYRPMPAMLAPQLRTLFASLLNRQTPVVYNCSAGQDRTGFATAMVLSALGVPREVILADYHLSTVYRRPQNEMPKIDLAAHPNDPVAKLFARYQDNPAAATPQPLKAPDGTPFLAGAFQEIDARWGSVEGYLQKEVGVGPAEIARLRQLYLE